MNEWMTGTKSRDNFFIRLLPLVTRLLAIGFLAFFSLLALHSLNLANCGPGYLSLVRWGQQSEAYELMICTIYLVWAIFLWRCAEDPLKEKTFLDFTVVANVAHFGVMFFQGLFLHGEHRHLFGDILLGWSGLIVFIIFWIPSRRFATQGGHS